MNKRHLLLWLGLAATSLAATKPNIILIMADDLGYEGLGANGDSEYRTPHLDKLAATGLRFEHAYSQPLCTPSRVKLMTGMSNARNYITFGVLDPQATTFGNLLQEAGYATGIVGKWQLGEDPAMLAKFGFDEFCLWHVNKKASRYHNLGSLLLHTGEELKGGYGPDRANDFARDFITRHKDGPFFLYYPMMLPHAPFEPTPDSPPGETDEKANFVAMVAYMDKLVGRLVATLEEQGVRENTLVIFTTDNGTHGSITSRFNGAVIKGGKGKMTDAGTRVPLVINWPAGIRQPGVNRELIEFSDFFPTVAEAAGVPAERWSGVDGRSFYFQLVGAPGTPRESIHVWYSSEGNEPSEAWARNQRYKLYRSGSFFDIAQDPQERNAVAVAKLSGEAAAAHATLQRTLAHFREVRPKELMITLDKVPTARAAKKRGDGY